MPAAVFDLDGTLLRSSELDDACYTDALKSVYGDIFPDHIDYGAEPEFTDEALARSVPGRFGAAVTDQTLRAHHDTFVAGLESESRRSPERCLPIAGAAEILLALLGAGWSVGIATGSWRRSAEIKLAAAGLPVSNVTVVTSSDPNLFENAIRMIPRQRAWRFSSVTSGSRPSQNGWSSSSNAWCGSRIGTS